MTTTIHVTTLPFWGYILIAYCLGVIYTAYLHLRCWYYFRFVFYQQNLEYLVGPEEQKRILLETDVTTPHLWYALMSPVLALYYGYFAFVDALCIFKNLFLTLINGDWVPPKHNHRKWLGYPYLG